MMLWKRLLSVAVLASLAMGLQPAQADSPKDPCSTFTVEVARMENLSSDASLLTQFPSEIKSAASYGFSVEKPLAFTASSNSGVSVWRLYNAKTYDFTWAADGPDLQAMIQANYEVQFKQFFASDVASDCLSAAHRLTKGNKTRIVVGSDDRDSSIRDGWKVSRSGVFYAVAAVPEPAVHPTTAPARPGPGETGKDEPGADAGSEEFTIAVIPDTQRETWSDSDPRFKNRSLWLTANASKENLRFVTHAGDVVDWGHISPQQYTRAKDGLSPLDGKVPYSLTVGNHDTAAVCQGGSACPGGVAKIDVRDTTAFNAAFDGSQFTNLRGQFEPGKVDNSYSTFEGGDQQWMVLNLELWPRKAAVDWAKRVVASHLDHNVIVATHSYLNSDGSIGTTNGGYGATSPTYLFDTLIKVYPNVKMVVSGHTGGGAAREDTGINGNKILSLLQSYHSHTTNPVRLIRINSSNGTVTHWVYAPDTNETLAERITVQGFDFTR